MAKEYSKDYFRLVQEEERLLDKPLKTKQLTYFQDAMLRFTKNKYNVIATIILAIFILMSIFVPILTPERYYNQTNSELKTLPPRLPLIEKLGIFDGVQTYLNQPIDYDTIDPETGLGHPTGYFFKEYILMETLTNVTEVGTERDPSYIGGTNELYINDEMISFGMIFGDDTLDDPSDDEITYTPFVFTNGSEIEIDINEFSTTGVVEIYYSVTNDIDEIESYDDFVLLGTVTSDGVTTINPMDALTETSTGYVVLRHVLDAPSEGGNEYISLNSVNFYFNDEIVTDYSGYPLSAVPLFVVDSEVENGRY